MWSAPTGGVIWCQLAFSGGLQRSLYCERKKGGRGGWEGGEDEREGRMRERGGWRMRGGGRTVA